MQISSASPTNRKRTPSQRGRVPDVRKTASPGRFRSALKPPSPVGRFPSDRKPSPSVGHHTSSAQLARLCLAEARKNPHRAAALAARHVRGATLRAVIAAIGSAILRRRTP